MCARSSREASILGAATVSPRPPYGAATRIFLAWLTLLLVAVLVLLCRAPRGVAVLDLLAFLVRNLLLWRHHGSSKVPINASTFDSREDLSLSDGVVGPGEIFGDGRGRERVGREG